MLLVILMYISMPKATRDENMKRLIISRACNERIASQEEADNGA